MDTCAARTVQSKFQHQGASHMSSRSLGDDKSYRQELQGRS